MAYGVGNALWYTSRVGPNQWTKEFVDSDCNHDMGLALDRAGNPHIGCGGNFAEGIYYFHKEGGVWKKELVQPGGTFFSRPGWLGVSTALDSKGNPHIAFSTIENLGFPDDPTHPARPYFASRDSAGKWTVEIIDASAQISGQFPSLVLDKNDRPHVSYNQEGITSTRDGVPVRQDDTLRYAEVLTALPEELAHNPPTPPTPPPIPPKITLTDGPYAEAGECQSDSPFASAICWRVGQNATVNDAPTNGVVQGRVEATKYPYFQRFYADFYISAAGQQQQVHQQGLP